MITRTNSGKPWKINTIGDPLITFGPRAARTEQIPDLPGAVSMETELKTALADKRYARGLRLLVMLGRLDDASQLGLAILSQDPEALTPEVAETLAPVFYRTDRPGALTTCLLAMNEQDRQDTRTVDMAWKALGDKLAGTGNDSTLDILSANIRDSNFEQDITRVTAATRRLRGDGAALAFLTRLSRGGNLSGKQSRFLGNQIERINPRRRGGRRD